MSQAKSLHENSRDEIERLKLYLFGESINRRVEQRLLVVTAIVIGPKELESLAF